MTLRLVRWIVARFVAADRAEAAHMSPTITHLLAEWRWNLRNGWWRTEARFWRYVAAQIAPHIPRGIHIHGGIQVTSDEPITGMTISGMSVRGNVEQPGIVIRGGVHNNSARDGGTSGRTTGGEDSDARQR